MNFEFDSFSRRMAEKYSKHFGVCADCIRSADSFLESIEGLGIGAENFTAVQLAISANFFKVCNSLISAYFLADAGLVEDVKTMTRKIIDLTVNMKYLSLDSDKRAADYLAFEAIHRKTTLDRVRSGAIPTSAFVQSGFECNASRIEAEYTTAIARYGQASKDEIGLRKRSWSGKFFTQMAKEAGLQNYVVPYELFCSATHADPGTSELTGKSTMVRLDLSKRMTRFRVYFGQVAMHLWFTLKFSLRRSTWIRPLHWKKYWLLWCNWTKTWQQATRARAAKTTSSAARLLCRKTSSPAVRTSASPGRSIGAP